MRETNVAHFAVPLSVFYPTFDPLHRSVMIYRKTFSRDTLDGPRQLSIAVETKVRGAHVESIPSRSALYLFDNFSILIPGHAMLDFTFRRVGLRIKKEPVV